MYASHVYQKLIYSLLGSDSVQFEGELSTTLRGSGARLPTLGYQHKISFPFGNFVDDFLSSSAICITSTSF